MGFSLSRKLSISTQAFVSIVKWYWLNSTWKAITLDQLGLSNHRELWVTLLLFFFGEQFKSMLPISSTSCYQKVKSLSLKVFSICRERRRCFKNYRTCMYTLRNCGKRWHSTVRTGNCFWNIGLNLQVVNYFEWVLNEQQLLRIIESRLCLLVE